ncbi:DUF3281 family protein [Francisella hispaniensis]|uniref:Lipoprotein n=1 Tax=Francisella hispaniensis FSC454 TaxID=1088883 RepID=A0AAC9NQ55_9GAMM|nr:DUF3281 family protein [Francisella hispaniensis]APD50742.1 hypothetical protein FSC454_06285 [Francisella hispaniensis FSC454]KYW85222.1 hypothetical protein AUF42_04795 [Francisella hispaniensis FSC454]
MKSNNILIMKKKLLISAAIVSTATLLGSCGKTETANELRIVDECNENNDLCRFELADTQVSRYTNILGKTIERVLSQTPLNDIQGTVGWNASAGASLADNSEVQSELGSSCQDNVCTQNSNSTAFKLPVGSNTIRASGTVAIDGKTVDLATDVPPVVINTSVARSSATHVFPTELNSLTLQKIVDHLNKNRYYAHGTFSADGNNIKIICDPGYVWLDEANPSYGQDFVSKIGRSVSVVTHLKGKKSKEEFLATRYLHSVDTLNGFSLDNSNNRTWTIGCWSVKEI